MNEVVFRTTARVAIPVIWLYAVYLLLRGHHEPGGGFIAGLVAAAALLLGRMAAEDQRFGNGQDERDGQGRQVGQGKEGGQRGQDGQRRAPDLPALAGLGLLVAAGTGLAAVVWGRPFLTSAVASLDLPVIGHVELASAVVFDLGVFVVVVGVAMALIEQLGRR